jgi:ribosomal protein S18 acetylase RimI-like enzyme
MGNISFRAFDPAQDGKLVRAFARDLFLRSFGNDGRFEREFGPDDLDYVAWLEQVPTEAMLAYEGDTAVGIVVLGSYKPDPTIGYVFHYCLIKQARGRSLGEALTWACHVHDLPITGRRRSWSS